jgi:hypothetical protein
MGYPLESLPTLPQSILPRKTIHLGSYLFLGEEFPLCIISLLFSDRAFLDPTYDDPPLPRRILLHGIFSKNRCIISRQKMSYFASPLCGMEQGCAGWAGAGAAERGRAVGPLHSPVPQNRLLHADPSGNPNFICETKR